MSIGGIFQHNIYLAKTGLGKSIILAGCLLHYGWALLLASDARAGGATPMSAVMFVFGNSRIATVGVLVIFSSLAMWYLSLRSDEIIRPRTFAFMLIPQLWLLLLSAGAGIYATCVGYYLDTVAHPGMFVIVQRPWTFILADQFPVIVMALLYMVAVLFAGQNKIECGPPSK